MIIYNTEGNTIHVFQKQMAFTLRLFVLKRDLMMSSWPWAPCAAQGCKSLKLGLKPSASRRPPRAGGGASQTRGPSRGLGKALRLTPSLPKQLFKNALFFISLEFQKGLMNL